MYKKLCSFLLTFAIFASILSINTYAAEPPQINAKGAIIGEMKTGEVVYEFNADEKLYPASTTKIMTAIIALENCSEDEIITVSSTAISGLAESGSSVLLKEGEQMRFIDMLTYLLVSSGNDAANALAEHVAGSQSAFVEMMNQKAQELGCQNTHFVNAHGLHNDEHYTTARDLMKIASYAMKNETFARIVKIDRTVLPATNKRGEQTISSTNLLISRWRRTDYFYEGAIGIKTGSTTPAGLCLVSGVNVDDLTYITVVLGASQGDDGAMGSFTETIKLLDYAKTGFALQNIASSTDPVTEAPVGLGKDVDSVILNPAEDVSALLPVGFDKSLINIESEVQPDIKAPVEKAPTLSLIHI